jgi:hypothetical protein
VQAGRGRAGRAAALMLLSGRRPGGDAPVRRRSPPPPRAPLLLPFPLLLFLFWCGASGRGKAGAARVSGAAGALIRGARVSGAAAAGGPQRPGRDAWRHHGGAAWLGGQHGRRDGFAPVSQCGDRRGAAQAGDASERGRGERGKGKRRGRKGNGGWSALSRGGASGARVERVEHCGRAEEGKADKRAPLVSCPGRKVKGRGDGGVWLGWAAACGARYAGKERKERRGAGLGRVLVGCLTGRRFRLAWAVGPRGV